MKNSTSWYIVLLSLFIASGCSGDHPMNSPYEADESGQNIFYSSFSERPKHLDPARSYSSNEYAFLGQIYEPLFQYHYLKRPYELIPLTAQDIPQPKYYNKDGSIISSTASANDVKSVVYEIKIKHGVKYQQHPAFAKNKDGKYIYHNLAKDKIKPVYGLKDFKYTGTRELTAEDYVYQIKRLASPQVHSPVFPVMALYISGFAEYSKMLTTKLETIRSERKAEAGAGYNQEQDEQQNPVILNLNDFPLAGVVAIDKYTLQIKLKKKYPQFIYWMAMPFFAPMPWEADIFYGQGELLGKQITLDTYPVGTGPYRLAVNNPNKEMILLKNENFHGELYPSEGFKGAKEKGLLKYAGKPLPFIEKAVYKLEKENIPYWNKFLQGYYDTSGITSDTFDQSVQIGIDGNIELTDNMKEKKIRLSTATQVSTYYIGFNMLDDVIGGYEPEKKKLRQAISIVVDYEEYIQIFVNGRGIAAQSLLPPGIFGFSEGKAGINPFVYTWGNGKPERKTISAAKKLLAEAGYPGGKSKKTGKPLLLNFDTAASGPDSKSYLNWLRKQFRKIDIQLAIRSTDYNRFQDKMLKGNAQIFQWGWNADYPDPENFFFLLYGPNKKAGKSGENAANYENPEFDTLFQKMSNMDNSPERLRIVRKMLAITQEDAPWIWGYHPIGFGLYHEWYKNAYPNLMANNTLKYKYVDPVLRKKNQKKWNKPVFWPIVLIFVIFIIAITPVSLRLLKEK